MGVTTTMPSSAPGTQSGAQSSHCPAAADVLYREGVDRLAANQNEVAANLFTQVLQLCPAHPTAGVMLQTARSRMQAQPPPATQPAAQPGMQTGTPSGPVQGSPQPSAGGTAPAVGTLAEGTSTVATTGAVPSASAPVPPPPSNTPMAPGVEYPAEYARLELVGNATGLGAGQGVGLCLLIGCQELPTLGAGIVGAALGAGIGWFGSVGGVTLGQATVIESGMWWGIANGATLGLLLTPDPSMDHNWYKVPVSTTMALSLIGTGVGVALAATIRPHSGDVSLANSGGIWTGILAAELFMAVTGLQFQNASTGLRAFGITELIAANTGLAAGALFGTQIAKYTRQRVLYMDAAVAAGTVGGWLTGLLFASGATTSEAFSRILGISMTFGTVLGITAAVTIVPAVEHSHRVEGPEIRRVALHWPSYTLTPMGPEGQPGLTLEGMF